MQTALTPMELIETLTRTGTDRLPRVNRSEQSIKIALLVGDRDGTFILLSPTEWFQAEWLSGLDRCVKKILEILKSRSFSYGLHC